VRSILAQTPGEVNVVLTVRSLRRMQDFDRLGAKKRGLEPFQDRFSTNIGNADQQG